MYNQLWMTFKTVYLVGIFKGYLTLPLAVIDGDCVFNEVVIRRKSVKFPLLDTTVVSQELNSLSFVRIRNFFLGQLCRYVFFHFLSI